MVLIPAYVLLTAQSPSLCFVARFYKPGAAKSRFELYLSDIQAKNRKLLPTTEQPVAVQWIGHDRLAWFTQDGGLWTSKLTPWKPFQLKKSSTFHFGESRYRDTEPGKPILVDDFDRTKGIFMLDPVTLKIEQVMETPHHEDIPLSEEKATVIPNPCSPDHPLSLKLGEEFIFMRGGKQDSCEWPPFRAWNTDGGTKLWIMIGSHTSTSGDVNGIMLFEKGKDPKTLFDEGNCVDFWPGRSLYAFCTGRNTTSLGKKEVWGSELYVGDWKKGYNRVVLTGTVWVPSVSIRP